VSPHANSIPGIRQWLYDTDHPLSTYSEDRGQTDSSIADWWKRCSGLHTVEEWVLNYRKHPAGWAALLAIQGIPEVTNRLRSKVENYAIYSALFLSFSVPSAMDLPPAIGECDIEEWSCVINKRMFMYLLVFSIVAHMLCILLAMSFINALNEAARDADVFRMFGRGQGFVATVKAQYAFFAGCYANFAALAVVGNVSVGWDVFPLWVLLSGGSYFFIFRTTSSLLFEKASIVDYWREDRGGKPDIDDPYDLRIVMELFRARAAQGRKSYEATVFEENDMQAASGMSIPEHLPEQDAALAAESAEIQQQRHDEALRAHE
jgi:hypothetical protein